MADNGNFVSARNPVNPDNKGYDIANVAQRFRNALPDDIPDEVKKIASVMQNSEAGKMLRSEQRQTLAPKAQESYPTPGTTPNKPMGQDLLGSFMNTIAPGVSAQESRMTPSPVNPTFPQQSQSPPQSYTVKPGDTLWGIAERTLGSGQRWNELQGYGGSPSQLPVGQQIRVPTTQPVAKSSSYSNPYMTPTPKSFTPSPAPGPTPQRSVSAPQSIAPSAPRSVAQPAPVSRPYTPAPVQTQRYTPAPPAPRPAPAPQRVQTPAPQQSRAPVKPASQPQKSAVQSIVKAITNLFKK